MTFVPTPPWGRMSVRMKANAKFGTEDPLQWPQVHVPDEDYCFLACIPRPSHPSRRSELWMPLTTEDFVKHIATTSDHPLYVMAPQRVPALKKVLQELRAEVQLYEQQYGPSAELTKFYSRTEAAYERLRLPVVSWRDLRCQYVAVERCYCMTIAWITWHTQLKKISDEEAPLDVLKHLMGCFTKDSKVVEKLYKAGIPVWYMRRIDTLTKEDHIHQYVSLQSPRGMVLQEGDYNDHPANHVGNPGQKQLEAICYKSDVYMDGSPSPETTLPRGVASSSSTHVPRTALADTTVSLNPNDLHDQFRDYSQEFMPSCIPVWQHALDTIWQNLGPIPSYSVWKYDLPRATDIIGLDGSDVDVRERRILNWLKLRNLWRSVLERNVTESKGQLGVLSSQEWQTYLDNGPSLSLTNIRPPEHIKVLQRIWEAIGAGYANLDTSRSTWAEVDIIPGSVDAKLCREVAWELNELAFFIELRYIDDTLSKRGRVKWRSTDKARQRLRENMFVEESHQYFFPSIPVENMGVRATYVHKREQYLESFRRLLIAWPNPPAILRECGPVQDLQYELHVKYVEEVMTQFYVRSFYRHTKRAPILPRRSPASLEATNEPYVPVPPSEIPDELSRISDSRSTATKRKRDPDGGLDSERTNVGRVFASLWKR
ncbi:hypothetical protein BC629DRAFT_1598257 [Irpex lacteus]|nr:hypothetical protein BC629DRAFT_1598257 [Irpex lacteus]